jgi:hypothetical protein
MRREDVLIEVRDRTLERVGTITHEFMDLTAKLPDNSVGEWVLTLPGAHPMVPHLNAEGSGIIVYVRGETWSGPTSHPAKETNRENPDGTWTFTGITDDIILADARAFPDPSNANPSTQSRSNDTRTGNAETLMRAYVAFNIANAAIMVDHTGAPAGRLAGLRRKLRVESLNQNRGPVLTKSPRFQILHELLSEIATYANLSYRVVQREDHLVFEVVTRRDRSDLVRLDIHNGTLSSEQFEKAPPTITRGIIAGQGEGTERAIVLRTNATAAAAEESWGRVIETFIDQRDAKTVVELEQSGDEKLIEGGFTASNIKVIASDDQTMEYGEAWRQGDLVAVVIAGQEVKTRVSAVAFVINKDAVMVGAAVGDVTGFTQNDALGAKVDDLQRRTDSLERSVSAAANQTRTTWVPIINNFTVNGAALSGYYSIRDGVVYGRLNITYTATTRHTGDFHIQLPVVPNDGGVRLLGAARYRDTSGSAEYVLFCLGTNNRIYMRVNTVMNGFIGQTQFGPTSPITPEVGDVLECAFSYPLD